MAKREGGEDIFAGIPTPRQPVDIPDGGSASKDPFAGIPAPHEITETLRFADEEEA